jgi:hypothetical protein
MSALKVVAVAPVRLLSCMTASVVVNDVLMDMIAIHSMRGDMFVYKR